MTSALRSGRRIFVAPLIVAALGGCATYLPPEAPPAAFASPPPESVPLYVAYDGFHAGLIVPTAAVLANPGPTAAAIGRLPPRPWTGLGYGDSKFYQHQGINPARVLDLVRSMLKPGNPSVVQVRGLDDPLHDDGHPKLVRLALPSRDFARFVGHVDRSFRLLNGAPIFVAQGSGGPDDAFFRGRTPASIVHECNQWLGETLGAAGVPHSYLADTTAPSLAADLVASGRAVRVPTAPKPTPTGAPAG